LAQPATHFALKRLVGLRLGNPQSRRRRLLPQLLFFLRRAAPLLVVSCLALLVLVRLLAPRLPNETAWFSLALVVASIVTLPHALLVTAVMDAPRWQGLKLGQRPEATPPVQHSKQNAQAGI
jgi:hypothetical protein